MSRIGHNRLMAFNWQQEGWPNFRYDAPAFLAVWVRFAERLGSANGMLSALTEGAQLEALIDIMVAEAITTSAIEGEHLGRSDVMSSIRKNLGFATHVRAVGDKRAVGAAELMVDVRRTFALPLSEAKLLDWHRMVMAGNRTVATGRWRAHREPMQVVSGSVGRQTVHFEAPPSERVPAEMARFIGWYNETAPNEANPIQNPIIRSAVAHLYFESVHPFEDGNGRIGRAIAEKALSQGVGRPVVLSLSRAIEADRAGYYTALQTAQRSNEITPWIYWFAQTVLEAQEQAQQQIAFTLRKSQLLDRVRDTLNDRQLKVVSRMLEEGPNGFKAGMSAKKYMSMTAVSKATATRDLQDLVAKGVLTATGDGRSTRYHVVV